MSRSPRRPSQRGQIGIAGKSVPQESLEAENLQPVGMRFSGQQFSRTFPNTPRLVAATEPVMVQEESQKVQVFVTDVPTQEKVVSQTAVEVLNNRTGPWRLGRCYGCRRV